MTFRRISILGLGLLGGSIGLAIKRRLTGVEISGYDILPDAIERAMQMGAIDTAEPDLAGVCSSADLVIICVPVSAFGPVIKTIAPSLKSGAIVTDVCSTKRSVCALADAALPTHAHFVGGHPMAGGEQSGIEAARADLFDNAKILLTPTSSTASKSVVRLEGLWQSLGSKTLRLSPALHDELVAQISHLPHAIASALINAVSDESLQLAGPGFKDVTRIAAGDPSLWSDILLDNADRARQVLKRFRDELDTLDAALESKSGDQLNSWLSSAAARRLQLKETPQASA